MSAESTTCGYLLAASKSTGSPKSNNKLLDRVSLLEQRGQASVAGTTAPHASALPRAGADHFRCTLGRVRPAEGSMRHLLQLAGSPPGDKKAVAWLREAIDGARSIHRAAKQRPLPADHNDLLADIEKSAKELTKRIHRLRRHPISWRAFWRSSAFGSVHLDRIEVREVLSTIENILRAADAAKNRHKGPRPEVGKQHVVNLAFAFFIRFSAHRPSGTYTGPFARFAHAFYVAVTGCDPEEHGGLDPQVRLSIERQRAQRKYRRKTRSFVVGVRPTKSYLQDSFPIRIH